MEAAVQPAPSASPWNQAQASRFFLLLLWLDRREELAWNDFTLSTRPLPGYREMVRSAAMLLQRLDVIFPTRNQMDRGGLLEAFLRPGMRLSISCGGDLARAPGV